MMLSDLRQEGAVLLISCYELGHQPMGLAWPAAFLERAGYHPASLDVSVEGFDSERVRKALFVGVSVPMHTALRLGFDIARHVRQVNPDCHICFYGLYALLNADYLLQNVANSVIGGEYEESLVRLMNYLEGNAGNLTRTLMPPEAGTGPSLKKLDFPVPRREKLPPSEMYVRLISGNHRLLTAYVEATRGCRHVCLHCPITPVYQGRFFIVPVDIVVRDIRQQVERGARHVTFGDPDFLNGPKHSLNIVKVLHHEFPSLTFDFTAKIEHLLHENKRLEDFARCGCVFVVSAVESFSDEVLTNLRKGHTRADVFAALRAVRGAGILLRPSLVSFSPWTTLEDYLDMLDIVEREGLIECIDPIQYAIRLLVPPGSALLEHPSIRPFLGELHPELFTYNWLHPDPRVDRLHRDVLKLVERAVVAQEDPGVTYLRIKKLALAARGAPAPDESKIPLPILRRAFRLTEPWFC